MASGKAKTKQGRVGLDEARRLVKVVAVMLRDESPMRADEAMTVLGYCWRLTESLAQSKARAAAEEA